MKKKIKSLFCLYVFIFAIIYNNLFSNCKRKCINYNKMIKKTIPQTKPRVSLIIFLISLFVNKVIADWLLHSSCFHAGQDTSMYSWTCHLRQQYPQWVFLKNLPSWFQNLLADTSYYYVPYLFGLSPKLEVGKKQVASLLLWPNPTLSHTWD